MYGTNLASASLPGQGQRVLHTHVEFIVQVILKSGGISWEREAENFLVDKVGEPYITRYISHVSSQPNALNSPHAIVPDVHAHNFCTRHQRVNDSRAMLLAEAFF